MVVSRLTRQGASKIEAKREAWKSRWDEALQGVGAEDLRAATQVLALLGDMFEDASPEEACEGPATGPESGSKPLR